VHAKTYFTKIDVVLSEILADQKCIKWWWCIISWWMTVYPRIRSGAVIFGGEWNEMIGWYAGIMFAEFIPCAKQQDI